MKTRNYINYFDEIRILEPSKQEDILEKARYEAFTNLKLSTKWSFYFILSFLTALLIAILPVYILGISFPVTILFSSISVFIFIKLYKYLNGLLLYKGLNHVLQRININE